MHPSGTKSRRAFAALAALLTAAAACERRDPPAAEPDRTPSSDSGSTAAADTSRSAALECINAADGYSVRYPSGWHVDAGPQLPPCSFFDPEPLQIPVASEVPAELGVTIGVEGVEFGAATGEMLGRRDLAREPVTVAGRRALRIEGETTGEGLYDRGIRSYQYFVDLGGRTLIGTTYDAGPLPFERKREALDAMMRSLRLHAREQDVP